jgi:type II secretory pathway pseudopilin PulG
MELRTTTAKHEGGFTLVEALVSVLILSASLVAITSLLTRALQATMLGQEYLIASKLAQESIEMVRVKRNNNLIVDRPWNENLIGTWQFESAAADPANGNILANGVALPVAPAHDAGTGVGLTVFRIYTSGAHAGKYTYSNAGTTAFVPGNFRRKVTVTTVNAYSAAVTATVYWGTGNTPLVLSSVIYDAT